jgi:hypothetical protein
MSILRANLRPAETPYNESDGQASRHNHGAGSKDSQWNPGRTCLRPRTYQGSQNSPARRIPLHARHPRQHVSRQALDHASILRLRHAGRDQPPVSLFAEPGPDRPFRGFRSPHAHGLRRRSPHGRGRSGQVWRFHFLARRHGAPVRRHPSWRRHGLDDHQLARAGHLGHVSGSKAFTGTISPAPCRTTSSRSTLRRRNSYFPRAHPCAW